MAAVQPQILGTGLAQGGPCLAPRCKLDLMAFDDEHESEQSNPISGEPPIVCTCDPDQQVPQTIQVTEPTQNQKASKNDTFNPYRKGKTTWDGRFLHAPATTILCSASGYINGEYHDHISGIDLVNWFTENYTSEKRVAAEAQKSRMLEQEALLERKRERSQRFNLLTLPAELRTKIYSYIIPEGRVLVCSKNPDHELFQPTSKKRSRLRLTHLLQSDLLDSGYEVSQALLLTCRKVKQEFEWFMYAELTFCFHSTKVINRFLHNTSPIGLKRIKKIELKHEGYGEPRMSQDVLLKQKHDRNWLQTCQRIAKQLPAVDSMVLDLKICDWPITFRPQDQWWQVLMHLIPNGGLKHVSVNLTHSNYLIRTDRLERASRRLEDRMMSAEGRRLRDEEEAACQLRLHLILETQFRTARIEHLKSLPPVQAKKVLRIILANHEDDLNKSTKPQGQKQYYTSNTAGYGYLEAPVDCDW